MLNKKVKHVAFGEGTIVEVISDKKISVKFDNYDENKVFQYPKAFENFLKFVDEESQDKAMIDLEQRNKEEIKAKEMAREDFERKFEEELRLKQILEKNSRKQARRKSTIKH